ncbi:putative protein kinase [Trypanosoma cruzi Dm28c]|uniref:Secreted protein n=1 Tax=Trypanosoma cruzi Dm28c TaxID=1416333 RepID=V5BE42_TRYCR|nr:putative protein kinase [Trypanosoma cruzi Dm28c]
MAYMFLFACASACVFGSAYSFKAAVRHKKQERNGRKKRTTHANYSYHHTHTHTQPAEWMHSTTNNEKQKAEAWDDQRTHSHYSRKAKHAHRGREREVAHSMQ